MSTVINQTLELWERDEPPEELRWIDSLSPKHQRRFFGELQFEWGRYCITKDEGALAEFFEDWKATSEVDANPEHAAFLLAPRTDGDYEAWDSKAAS